MTRLEGKETHLVDAIIEAARPFEFRSFVLGFEREAAYERSAHEAEFRSLKIAIGKELTRRWGGIDADFRQPELRLDISLAGAVKVTPAPLFLGGRYRKLSRDIPSTRWIHHACRGRGCASCSHTGNLCGPSIQELLEKPVLEASGGERTLLHTCGREDTDARMLGRGRPFVLEVHRPLRRVLPLGEIQARFQAAAGDLAEVLGLAPADSASRGAVKAAAAEKTYRAWLEPGGPLPPDSKGRAERLAGQMIDQASPTRVKHRKGRSTHRQKRVLECHWMGEIDCRFALELRVQSGTYVKELVSGDEGRTRPSLAEVLGVPCRCAALDVLEVHYDPPWEHGYGAGGPQCGGE